MVWKKNRYKSQQPSKKLNAMQLNRTESIIYRIYDLT